MDYTYQLWVAQCDGEKGEPITRDFLPRGNFMLQTKPSHEGLECILEKFHENMEHHRENSLSQGCHLTDVVLVMGSEADYRGKRVITANYRCSPPKDDGPGSPSFSPYLREYYIIMEKCCIRK